MERIMEIFNIFDIVEKLVGEIEPVGSTHVDKERFKNLKVMIKLMDDIYRELDHILYENKDMNEDSIKESVEYINKFFDRIGIPKE